MSNTTTTTTTTTTTGSVWDDVDAVRYPDGEVAEVTCAAPYLHHATRSGDEITATDDNGDKVVLLVVTPEDGEICTGCAGDWVTVWAEGRWWSSAE